MALFDIFGRDKTRMVTPDEAIVGRAEPITAPGDHAVNGRPMDGPYPEGSEVAYFAMGCFWGAERLFWQLDGVWVTAVGYAGGFTENPTYEETCTAKTGHTETVKVVFEPSAIRYGELLKVFWEEHDPTQYMRQGNDVGTQYRSAIFTTTEAQLEAAKLSEDAFQLRLGERGFGDIVTEIHEAGPFYYAEEYHQQYLHKVPNGYCGLSGTGASCPVGLV